MLICQHRKLFSGVKANEKHWIFSTRYFYLTQTILQGYEGKIPPAACILLAVSDYENISQNQVARSLVIDKGLATREINKMEKLNYLTKSNGAGKTKILNLTETGNKVVDTVQHIRSQWWEDRFAKSGITPDSPLVSSIEAVVSTIIDPIE